MDDRRIDELAKHISVKDGKVVVDSEYKWVIAKDLLREAFENFNPYEKWWQKIPRALNVPQKIRRTFVHRKYEKLLLNVMVERDINEKKIEAGIASRSLDDFGSDIVRRSFAESYCQKLDNVKKNYIEEWSRPLIRLKGR